MFPTTKTDDGRIKGRISFYCRVLHVSRQAFHKYLKINKPKRKPDGITKADREARKSEDLTKRDFTAEKPYMQVYNSERIKVDDTIDNYFKSELFESKIIDEKYNAWLTLFDKTDCEESRKEYEFFINATRNTTRTKEKALK